MKRSPLGFCAALLTSLLLGAAGGFLVGNSRKEVREKKDGAQAAVVPHPPGTPSGGARGSNRGPGNSSRLAKTTDLAGLPPGEAWRRLLEIPDPAAKADAVGLLLDSIPPTEWPLWLARMIESFKGEDIDEHDPEQMAGLFGTLNAVIQHMVATHPGECLKAMLSVDKEHSHGDDLVEPLMKSWARRDVEAARRFYETEIVGRTDQNDRARRKAEEIAGSLVREMARSNPPGTMRWAAGLPEDLRSETSKTAFASWFKQDSNAARAAFEGMAPDTRGPLLQSMVGNAQKNNIGALADMLAHEPISAHRAEASQTLMRQWVEQDPTAASGWLAQQPAGEVQDRAIVGFVNWADGNEPQAALEWAGTISDPQLRSRQLEGLVNRYRSSDAAMARSWINSTTRLTSDERARFLEATGK